jgi:hypothetical protein
MQSDAASLSDVRLALSRRASLSKRRMTVKVILLSALFLRLIIVNLDVRAANISLGHDHRAANIG